MSLTKVSFSMITGAYVNVLDYGADPTGATDSSAAFQAAIDEAAGKYVYAPAGTYRINTQLTYNTSTVFAPGLKLVGDGMEKTIFDTRVAGIAMLSISGGDNFTFQTGGHLADFSIITNGAPALADGIALRSVFHWDIERVSVKGLERFGFHVFSLVAPGDPDSSSYVNFHNCRSNFNGIGFRLTSAAASLGVVNITIEDSSASTNTDTGISMSNVTFINILNNDIAANLQGGITLAPNNVSNQVIHIDQNEFGNGNTPWNCNLGGAISGSFNGNRIVQNAGEAGEFGLILGDATNLATNFEVRGNLVRIDPTINPFTAFYVRLNTADIQILDTFFLIFGAAGQIKYDLDTGEVTLREEGQSWNNCIKMNAVEPTTSYTPDMNEGELHRVRINATGAFTINTPINEADGKILQLMIINQSGGSVTVSFGAGFIDSGYTDPADGTRATASYFYDSISGVFVQIGAWATNIT